MSIELSKMKDFLRGLKQVVAQIPRYPDAARIILPGNTASALLPRIERYARELGISLPPIITVKPKSIPDLYVLGVNKRGHIVKPRGITLVIDDVSKFGEKIGRIRQANPLVRIFLVACKDSASVDADFVALPGRADITQWRIAQKTPFLDRIQTDGPEPISHFKGNH